ncbi:MAG: GNAT family N-acetyltransferase [Myxococcales bacterium]|nr:GNAT family N-acetyltransferase [Myxococcales bacterium]MBK7196174.1 GNAT family N-acetyltransferase [Myxococcales bacterium]MBP6843544.1 GNAT family N-acetyltransferase [Kofleriaceae bacterium]
MIEPRVEAVTGAAVGEYLAALAVLRIEVFREWPYLYDGDVAYEERYLAPYATTADALVAIAWAGDGLVGAATALPLAAHSDEVVPPLVGAGYDPATVYYFGESVLRRDFRGRGLGHRFFDEREAFARARGYRTAAFCAVDRPADHPRRPADYVPLDRFWGKRGFVRRPDIIARFAWKDLDADAETAKPMVFWTKALA